MIEPEAPFDDFEDKSGMTVVSGTVTLKKNHENLIGISIGGGAPFCPCLYIVQLYDKTPAFTDASLQCGDEIVAINGTNVKGLSKTELAKLIQGAEDQVTVQYNKLICDTKRVSLICTQMYVGAILKGSLGWIPLPKPNNIDQSVLIMAYLMFMIRVTLASYDRLTSFDLMGQTFRVDVELTIYYHCHI